MENCKNKTSAAENIINEQMRFNNELCNYNA